MTGGWRGRAISAVVLLGGCSTLSKPERLQAADYAEQRAQRVVHRAGQCAVDSPLLALGDRAYAESTSDSAAPRRADPRRRPGLRCSRACT